MPLLLSLLKSNAGFGKHKKKIGKTCPMATVATLVVVLISPVSVTTQHPPQRHSDDLHEDFHEEYQCERGRYPHEVRGGVRGIPLG